MVLALKEWSPVVYAMSHTRHATCLFRKGGILDSGPFLEKSKMDENLILFFPTSFHASTKLLKEEYAELDTGVDFKNDLDRIPIDSAFRITGAWLVYGMHGDIGAVLEDFHVYRPEFFATRLPYKPEVPLSILEVQVFRLQISLMIPNEERLWGCFSWLNLAEEHGSISDQGLLTPAIPPGVFVERQQALRDIIASHTHSDTINTVIDRCGEENMSR